MKQINRRVNALNGVQEAIVALTGITTEGPQINDMVGKLCEVRKELAYEIFRG